MAGGRSVTARNRVGIAAFAAASFLAFPQRVGDHLVDLGLLFAWIVPACLVVALDGLSPRRAAWAGFWAGWLAHTAILYWIYLVTAVYGRAPVLVGVAAPGPRARTLSRPDRRRTHSEGASQTVVADGRCRPG